MTHCDRASIACWNSFVISVCLLAAGASLADTVCLQWDVSGDWTFIQTNDTAVSLTLKQTEHGFSGQAHFGHWVDDDFWLCNIGSCGEDFVAYSGPVVGSIKDNAFEATVYWSDNKIGVYTGQIGPQGLIVGTGYDKNNPGTRADWHSDRVAVCSNSAAAAPLAPARPPVALGRVSAPTTPAPAMTVCEAAKSARARNSPAAPSLEKQCEATNPPKALGRVAAAGAPAPVLTLCEAARSARERKSPAAPSLEAQCAAQSAKPALPVLDEAWRNDTSARGEALGAADPLAAELRNSIPEGKSRTGFDYGMAVAESDSANGPGKQAIHDALDPDERFGFERAVRFSVERNANADTAGKGAAIMVADPTVAAVRDGYAAAIAKRSGAADQAAFYKLGFDIATGLFGDPDLGAAGNTLIGPGSLKVRSSLAPGPEQTGFDDAVSFHLKRDYHK